MKAWQPPSKVCQLGGAQTGFYTRESGRQNNMSAQLIGGKLWHEEGRVRHNGEMVAIARVVSNILDQTVQRLLRAVIQWFSASKVCANITKSLN